MKIRRLQRAEQQSSHAVCRYATISTAGADSVCGVRVAIVAESFLPQVNGVSNSVVKVLEHLRRTGHEALVIAPDTPPGEDRAERLHDGVRVHRVPSRMFPKVTTLPLGVPTFRMLRALRGFRSGCRASGVAGAAWLRWTPCRSAARCPRSRSTKPMFRVSRPATAFR